MDFLGDILGGVLNVGSGGLLGMAGAVIGTIGNYFTEKQRQAWQKLEWENDGLKRTHELLLLDRQLAAGKAETEQEIAIATASSDAAARTASYRLPMHKAEAVSGWVNNIRSLFRPALTVFLWILAFVLLFWISSGEGVIVAPDEVDGLVGYAVRSIVFAASTATFWWFGDRALKPPASRGTLARR